MESLMKRFIVLKGDGKWGKRSGKQLNGLIGDGKLEEEKKVCLHG